MSSFAERLNYYMEKRRVTGTHLAQITGITAGAISHWRTGRRNLTDFRQAQLIANALEINVEWLITGKGAAEGERVVSLPDKELPSEGYVQIKEFSVKCGAGPGGTPTYEEEHDSVPATYRESFFLNLGIKPEDCMRFRVHGDSMEPTLFDGDRILVHLTDNQHIENNHVYAINVGSEVRVKRLIRQINGDLIIHSDNSVYPDEVIRHEDDSIYFSVIGRVIEKTGHGGL